jgi:AMP deaminase
VLRTPESSTTGSSEGSGSVSGSGGESVDSERRDVLAPAPLDIATPAARSAVPRSASLDGFALGASAPAAAAAAAAPTLSTALSMQSLAAVTGLEDAPASSAHSAATPSGSGACAFSEAVDAPGSISAAAMAVYRDPFSLFPLRPPAPGPHTHVHASSVGTRRFMTPDDVDVSSLDAFQRVVITGRAVLTSEQKMACKLLRRAMDLREKHLYKKPAYYWGSYKPSDFPSSPKPRSMGGAHHHSQHVHGHNGGTRAHSAQSTPLPSADGASVDGGAFPGTPAANGAWSRAGNSGAVPAITPFQPTLTGGTGDTPYGHGLLSPSGTSILSPSHPLVQQPGAADPPSPNAAQTQLVAGEQGANAAGIPRSPAGIAGRGGPGAKVQVGGSKLVSRETGKEYGNLFYRRRAEPPFRPFEVDYAGPLGFLEHRMVGGIMRVFDTRSADSGQGKDDMGHAIGLFDVPSFSEYMTDYLELCRIVHNPAVKSFAFRRLELLSARFQLHVQLNAEREIAESKAVPHRDFYNVRKVDTHVHHSACMNQKHLLRFIKHKLKHCPDEVVIFRDGKHLTLAQVFQSLSLTAYDLSVDTLDMHADWTTFHRFDRFNLKYNPVGQSRLREIFLKTDNFITGKYLAEITREVFDDLEATKYALAEYRVSIYGKSKDEWSRLAAWVVDNRLASPTVRWMVQIPRLYEVYRETGAIENFQQMLENIFEPLFEVTRDPAIDPKLHLFLAMMVGFDSVDDESKQELHRDGASQIPTPKEWTFPQQPPYYYWNYFLAANIATLNKYREARGLTLFSFRPHSGEAGDVDHLAATFLCAESINHGINLKKNPALQYLYYLSQVGLAVSPLSNNRLFVEYNRNPFFEYFSKGLNVSLSTDDPLMLAYTKEPLLEEYCVAAQVWKLSNVDMCEIARNSVLQSGFEHPFKSHFIGPTYAEPGPAGNDIHMTNVPYIRLQYRFETLEAEKALIEQGTLSHGAPAAPVSTTASAAVVATRAAQMSATEIFQIQLQEAARTQHESAQTPVYQRRDDEAAELAGGRRRGDMPATAAAALHIAGLAATHEHGQAAHASHGEAGHVCSPDVASELEQVAEARRLHLINGQIAAMDRAAVSTD